MIKKIFQAGLLLSLLVCSSCNKWLDLQPLDGITKQEFWKTKEDVRSALMGIYTAMVGGEVEERIFTWGELRADMVEITVAAPVDYGQVRRYNILSTNDIADWTGMYKIINDCNLLLDFAGEAKSLDPTFTDELYNSYIGEALTIRSLMYFYLVRSFRDVPLKLKGTYKDSDVKEIGKTPAADVLKQIISDLNTARNLVPKTHSTNAVINKGRITKYAVHALLADVYLWNEQYQEAANAADSVLVNENFRLVNNSSGWLTSVFEQGSSSETIFELSHQTSLNNIFYGLLAGPARFYTTSDLVTSNIFIPNDKVDVNLVDGRNVFFNTSGTIVKYGDSNPSFANFQIYRISDMLLIKAEAINQLGRGDEALELIGRVRTARGALAATKSDVIGSDKDGVNSYILDERAREFAYEGKRWFDLLRSAKRNNYADLSVLVNLITSITDVSVQQGALNKVRNVDSHYLPILESELFADTKLVQNPFYLK